MTLSSVETDEMGTSEETGVSEEPSTGSSSENVDGGGASEESARFRSGNSLVATVSTSGE